MTRRGTAKKCAKKDSNKPTTTIANPRIKEINKKSNEKDEKAVVTSTKPFIKRTPTNSEIRGKPKSTAITKVAVTKSSSIAKKSNLKPIKSNYVVNSAKTGADVVIKPLEISSDVSDYYSEDFYDSEDYDSDDDCGPYGCHNHREGYEYLHEIFYGSRSSRCAYDTSVSDDSGSGDMFDSDCDSSEMEDILEEFMRIHAPSYVAIHAIHVTTFLENFQNNNATPIVRARIQDFIRSMTLMPFSNLLDSINYFKIELAQLSGNPLTDFPVYNSQGSTNFASSSRSILSNTDISRLPRHSYRGQTQREKRLNESPHKCCICMAELEIGEELILLEKCSHRFHSGCLESWLRRSDHCPICRATVKPPPSLIN